MQSTHWTEIGTSAHIQLKAQGNAKTFKSTSIAIIIVAEHRIVYAVNCQMLMMMIQVVERMLLMSRFQLNGKQTFTCVSFSVFYSINLVELRRMMLEYSVLLYKLASNPNVSFGQVHTKLVLKRIRDVQNLNIISERLHTHIHKHIRVSASSVKKQQPKTWRIFPNSGLFLRWLCTLKYTYVYTSIEYLNSVVSKKIHGWKRSRPSVDWKWVHSNAYFPLRLVFRFLHTNFNECL